MRPGRTLVDPLRSYHLELLCSGGARIEGLRGWYFGEEFKDENLRELAGHEMEMMKCAQTLFRRFYLPSVELALMSGTGKESFRRYVKFA